VVHSKYDLEGALESAIMAAARTGRPRFVVCQAIGWDIQTKRPTKNPYLYYEVTADGAIGIFDEAIDKARNKVKLRKETLNCLAEYDQELGI